MKKLLLLFLVLFVIVSAHSQVPQALNYQAVARNSMGQMVPSQSIGVRFTVLDQTGTNVLYQETHATTTNNFGLFTLAIGKGTAVSGTFAAIDWAATGDKFLKVEIAPQGGTNYTIQGITQFLSIPYALYAEKTKLVAGNAITISNGNTISANYVAGPGITINGNVISSSASAASWLLNGNAGTTTANFLGTTDNMPLVFKTNNMQRMSIRENISAGGINIGAVDIGQLPTMATHPGQLSINGKDMCGLSFPLGISASVEGMNWSPSGGANNTLGRMLRFAQWTTAGPDHQFYDVGIDQGGDFFIAEHALWSTGGFFPKKMFTISPQNFVGINFGWGEHPTANFHTKGSIRFEGVTANNALTRVLVMDGNGNVASRDASTFGGGGGGFWVADANGIRNSNTGHVGIGGPSNGEHTLNVEMMENTVDGRPVARISTNDIWQTNLWLFNTTNNASFSLVTGGSGNTFPNYGVGARNFGIVNQLNPMSAIPLIITFDNKVGISDRIGGTDNLPKSRLHVRDGDIYIDQVGAGVIMKSPNGQCWRMTVSDAGTPVFTAIPCR